MAPRERQLTDASRLHHVILAPERGRALFLPEMHDPHASVDGGVAPGCEGRDHTVVSW